MAILLLVFAPWVVEGPEERNHETTRFCDCRPCDGLWFGLPRGLFGSGSEAARRSARPNRAAAEVVSPAAVAVVARSRAAVRVPAAAARVARLHPPVHRRRRPQAHRLMNPSYTPPSPSAERVSYAPQRRGGGGGGGGNNGGGASGGQAVPRGSSGSSGGEGSRGGARAPSGSTSSSAGSNENGGDCRAVPTYSRPRGDRPVNG